MDQLRNVLGTLTTAVLAALCCQKGSVMKDVEFSYKYSIIMKPASIVSSRCIEVASKYKCTCISTSSLLQVVSGGHQTLPIRLSAAAMVGCQVKSTAKKLPKKQPPNTNAFHLPVHIRISLHRDI